MDSAKLQKRQAEFDAKYWEHAPGDYEKILHITLHMGKLLGKLSTYCEAIEHGAIISEAQIRNEVIPDLQVYAYQLANIFEENAGARYFARLEQLAAHYEAIQGKKEADSMPHHD